MSVETHGSRRGEFLLLALLLAAAALHGAWNAWQVPPLTGYDAGGHAAYVYTVAEEGRLPLPTEGWSTFHPPLYYLLGARVWELCEPLGARPLGAALRGIGLLALLGAALAGYLALRSGSGSALLAWVGTALFLFVPGQQMAAAMIGNEALGAALSAFALLAILALQRDPDRFGVALLAGLLTGLALITKYSGVWVACALVVPFLRRGHGRLRWRALLAAGAAAAAVSAPVYVRNIAECGTPLPMTRELGPMKRAEEAYALRSREARDYLSFPPACVLHPSIYYSSMEPATPMQSVWGLAYASTWSDAFGHRIPTAYHRAGDWRLSALALLGLVPTALALLGLLCALWGVVRGGVRTPEAPLVVMTLAGLATFVLFTWKAPSLVAAKGSYLLPLGLPAVLFFARGLSLFPERLRTGLLALSLAAALLAAVVFTAGLLFDPLPPDMMPGIWRSQAAALPGANIAEAVEVLTRGW